MPDYVDSSYPSTGPALRYRRGDGVLVTLLTEGAAAPPPEPPDILNLFNTPPAPAPAAVLPPPVLVPQALTPIKSDQLKLVPSAPEASAIFDNPIIGGRFTVFVLFYGGPEYHDMHRRCLDNIVATVPAGRMDLRVGSNQLCDQTLQYLEEFVRQGVIRKHYRHPENAKKYPVMREMFWDPQLPIETNWVIWFDDDSIVEKAHWLSDLGRTIIANAPKGAVMLGGKYYWELKSKQAAFYRSRPWRPQGLPFRDTRNRPAANGNCIHFITGACWALSTAAIRQCNIPPHELDARHNGGDVMIGEVLYAHSLQTAAWNSDKSLVRASSVGRRGLSEKHPGVE